MQQRISISNKQRNINQKHLPKTKLMAVNLSFVLSVCWGAVGLQLPICRVVPFFLGSAVFSVAAWKQYSTFYEKVHYKLNKNHCTLVKSADIYKYLRQLLLIVGNLIVSIFRCLLFLCFTCLYIRSWLHFYVVDAAAAGLVFHFQLCGSQSTIPSMMVTKF